MAEDFRDKDYGKVLKHKLGFPVTVIQLDPQDRYDSFHSSRYAFCRYHHKDTGDLLVSSFVAEELVWPKEEEEE